MRLKKNKKDMDFHKEKSRVLVVDDEPSMLQTVSSLIEHFGYSATSCKDARDALACLKKESFDVVLTDINMQEVSGLELLEEIKNIDSEIPVILMTGYAGLDSS